MDVTRRVGWGGWADGVQRNCAVLRVKARAGKRLGLGLIGFGEELESELGSGLGLWYWLGSGFEFALALDYW